MYNGFNSPCRAMTSTSITAQPSCWNTWMTELLPEAMPPVRPTRNIFPGERDWQSRSQETLDSWHTCQSAAPPGWKTCCQETFRPGQHWPQGLKEDTAGWAGPGPGLGEFWGCF